MQKDKEILLKCTCGCSILALSRWEEDNFPPEYIISLYSITFGEKQNPIWHNIQDRLKMIWCAIRGKQFYFYDLIISKDQLEEFKKFVNDPF